MKFLTFLALLTLYVCSPCAAASKVLVSIAPLKTVVEHIAHDKVEVVLFVPPGASPHSYEPSAKQLLNASDAQIWFRIGEGFEKRALEFLQAHVQTVDVRSGLSLIADCCCCSQIDAHDVHIWLSPRLMISVAETIARELSSQFPEERAFFEANLAAFVSDLQMLDKELSTQLQTLHGTAILASHPAFGYFCRDYGLEQLSVEVEGKEPSLQQATKLIQEARLKGVDRALVQPQYNRKGIDTIAGELSIPLFDVDPYEENFLATLRHLTSILTTPLSNDSHSS